MKLVAYSAGMRQRQGEILGAFEIQDREMRSWICDSAEEDGSVHVDTLMDLAHDRENLDLIEFLTSLGLYTDYIFIEEDMK